MIPPSKITIFLDIDGVLNVLKDASNKGMHISPYCVGNLQYLIDTYNADVCIISSWRIIMPTNEIFAMLTGAGLRVPIGRRLPSLPPPDGDDIRGPKIEKYCEERGIDTNTILIIDDDGPGTLKDRWVKTHNYDGFTRSRVDEAERILRGEPLTRDPLGTLLEL